MSDYPRLKHGTFVRATITDHENKSGWTPEALRHRVLFNEMVGEVVGHSDSHGLCYEVKFRAGSAWYNPDELQESV